MAVGGGRKSLRGSFANSLLITAGIERGRDAEACDPIACRFDAGEASSAVQDF